MFLSVIFSTMSVFMFQTVADMQKDDSYRHSALEVMVSLCENATGMVKKKASSFIPALCKFSGLNNILY